MAFISSAVLVVVIAFLVFKYLNRKKPDKPYPPGPRGWDLVRAFVSSMDGTLALHVKEWARKYGDIIYVPHPQGNMVFLASPSVVKEMYTGKATEKHANDRMWSYVADKLCLRKNLAFTNPSDPNWPKMRKLMHSNMKFYGEGIAEFETLVMETLDKMVKELEKANGQNVMVKDVMEDSVTSIIGVLLTGESTDKGSPVWEAMREFNEGVLRIADPAFSFAIKVCPFIDYIPGTYYYKSRKQNEKAKQVLYENVLLERKKTRTPGLPRGAVDHLFEFQSKEGADWLTDDHVMGNIMDVTAGGTNTSTQSICANILYLLHHQDMMRKIQQEVDAVIGHDRKPSLNDRRECHYTEAFILEAFRYASVVPLGFDHFINEDVEIRGYTVPKGSVAFSAGYVFHKSDKLWEDTDAFKPERFLDDKGHILPVTHPTRQNLMPFSTGKRACPGEGFARARIFLFLTTILQQFDVLPPTNEKLMTLGPEVWNFGLISTMKPFHSRFVQRQL
ncbi:cytochrome P450 2U1-like [Babylonia areolata]|uniref:cytochrome P450 2U1-like n=1 Tax=Babylonia areolata TaxID=304850 RepID=UPI003FD1574E